MPPTYVPIPLFEERCDRGKDSRGCCGLLTFPLIVCIAITIHKVQGMTIGKGHVFEKMIMYFPRAGSKAQPGIEYTATTRPENIDDFAIGGSVLDITQKGVMKIGSTSAYKARNEFQKMVQKMSDADMVTTKAAISAQDPNADHQTYDGGCDFLIQWYRDKEDAFLAGAL